MNDRVIEGRVATQADVDSGRCIFYIPDGRSLPFEMGRPMPISAKIRLSGDGVSFPSPGTLVDIVQAEVVDGTEILIGFLAVDMEGVCMLEDVEIAHGAGVQQTS